MQQLVKVTLEHLAQAAELRRAWYNDENHISPGCRTPFILALQEATGKKCWSSNGSSLFHGKKDFLSGPGASLPPAFQELEDAYDTKPHESVKALLPLTGFIELPDTPAKQSDTLTLRVKPAPGGGYITVIEEMNFDSNEQGDVFQEETPHASLGAAVFALSTLPSPASLGIGKQRSLLDTHHLDVLLES